MEADKLLSQNPEVVMAALNKMYVEDPVVWGRVAVKISALFPADERDTPYELIERCLSERYYAGVLLCLCVPRDVCGSACQHCPRDLQGVQCTESVFVDRYQVCLRLLAKLAVEAYRELRKMP
ncbi:MAG: hypothetical protein QXT13_07520 [Pyrobaculum sp.]